MKLEIAVRELKYWSDLYKNSLVKQNPLSPEQQPLELVNIQSELQLQVNTWSNVVNALSNAVLAEAQLSQCGNKPYSDVFKIVTRD